MKDCVKSIKCQTYTNYEVWIVDGDSSDGTKDFLQTLKEPFYAISEKDTGIYDAMNKGIKVSKGEWLYFLGADDVLSNSAILGNVSKELSEDLDVVSGNVQYATLKKDTIFRSEWTYKLWIKNTVHHQATFYKRKLFTEVFFDVHYKVLADYAFNIDLFKKKIKGKTIQTIIALCGIGGISKTYNWSLYKEEIRIKTKASSIFLWPIFYGFAFLKYINKTRFTINDKAGKLL